MKFLTARKALSLLLATIISVGNTAFAGSAVEIRSNDVSLNQGVLVGSVVNTSALPVSGIRIHLLHKETVVATAISDEKGQFVVKGLRNGGHVLQVGTTQQPVRFWSQQSAPPSSSTQMAVVVDEDVVRGQGCGEDGACSSVLSSIGSNPLPLLLVGGAVAATIAISNSRSDASP